MLIFPNIISQKKIFHLIISILFLFTILSCNFLLTESKNNYKVIYNSNGANSSIVPIDENMYSQGDSVVIKSSESMSFQGYTFNSWNTEPQGNGIKYNMGDTIFMSAKDTELFAQWIETIATFIETDELEEKINLLSQEAAKTPINQAQIDEFNRLQQLNTDNLNNNTNSTDYITGASGLVYYISSSGGNDSNDGLTPSSPWKTFLHISNYITGENTSRHLYPGCVVLLKRGDVWNDEIYLNGYGNINNKIVLSNYGTGELPLIKGNVSSTAWEKLNDGVHTNIYRALVGSRGYPNSGYDINNNSLNGKKNRDNFDVNTDEGRSQFLDTLEVNRFGPVSWRSSKYIYVKCPEDKTPSELGMRFFFNAGLDIRGGRYLIVDGIKVEDAAGGIYLSNGNNVTLKNCVINNTLAVGLQISGVKEDFQILNNIISNTGNNSIYTTRQIVPILIKGNDISSVGSNVMGILTSGDQNAIGFEGSANHIIEYNYIHNMDKKVFDFYINDNITIRYNYVYNCGGFASPHGVNIKIYNNIYNAGSKNSSMFISASNAYSPEYHEDNNYEYEDGDILIYNNIFYGANGVYGLRTDNRDIARLSEGKMYIYNNIIYTGNSDTNRIIHYKYPEFVVSDFNLFYSNTSKPNFWAPSKYETFSEYREALPDFDKNSLYQDPMFIKDILINIEDFLLEDSSPYFSIIN